MPWGRCDDGFYDHAKVRALAPRTKLAAIGLYWRTISFCNRQLNDGRMTADAVEFLDGTTALADELVRVGLWDRDRWGLRVHDYLAFNKSRDQVLRERGIRSEAGKLGGIASGKQRRSKREPKPKQVASQLLEPPSRPSSSLRSEDSQSQPEIGRARNGLPHVDVETAQLGEQLTGHTFLQAGHAQQTELDRLIEDHGAGDVRQAMKTYAASNGGHTSWRQLVWGSMKVLEPINAPRPPSPREEREDVIRRAEERARGSQA